MLPPDLPPDRTMTSLGWLIYGPDMMDHADTILVTMPGGGTWCIMNHELEQLTDKGWVDLTVDEHVTVTSKGTYWYDRWRREKLRESFRDVLVTDPLERFVVANF